MVAVESLRPVVHGRVSLNWYYNPKCFYRQSVLSYNRQVFWCGNSIRFVVDTTSFRAQLRICKSFHGSDISGPVQRRVRYSGVRIQAKSSCEQDTDSTETKEAKTTTESKTGAGSGSSRKEKQGKESWLWSKRGKWRLEPIVQAREMGVLLLQLGIVMFVMRLLRPGLPLPGTEPRAPTTFVSVPYSEFLSKINSNQVQKVEVDGVHVMFKLKTEVMSGSVESEGVSSRLQDSEFLLRSVNPTRRIVYTTTRPSDIKTPYEKMLENNVEFGSPDKRSGSLMNFALVIIYFQLLMNIALILAPE